LRSVDIEFDSKRVLPGNTLSGHRSIDEECHMTRVFRISESTTISEGTTIFPFSFQLPRGLPPTYRRFSNYIRHTVEGVVEVDWALDPKSTQEFHVLQTRPSYLPEDIGVETAPKSNEGLHIQSNGILRMDTGILVGFKVDDEKRMKRVRFEIIRREDAKCRWHETSSKRTMKEKYFELEPDDWGRWKEIQFGEEWRFHLPFKSTLIRVSYHLKVTYEIGLKLDPSIEIPLRFSDFTSDTEVLDDIALDLGLDDW
jgi:hypothetical protein